MSNGLDPHPHQYFLWFWFRSKLFAKDFTSCDHGCHAFVTKIISFVEVKWLSFVYILGILSEVKGTKFDLRNMTWLGKRIPEVPGNYGFDHNFCVGETGWMKHAAR